MEPLVDAPPGSSLAQNAQGNFSFLKILEKQMPDFIMIVWFQIGRRCIKGTSNKESDKSKSYTMIR